MPRAYSCGEHMRYPLPENLGNQDSYPQSQGETKQNLLYPLIQEYSEDICIGHSKKKDQTAVLGNLQS